MSVLLILLLPAVFALVAVVIAIVLARRLSKESPAGRKLLWVFIVLLCLAAFGIGTCYVMVFSSLKDIR
ncbi:MAG: hypothetical protein H0X38_13635 [Planctomycetes bacterium]|nr:hypothetical protein [Planctomycetota bacterium]